MLNYIESGSEKNLIIFVHGNSSSAKSWTGVMENLNLSKYKKAAIDLPGHGANPRKGNAAQYACNIVCSELLETITKIAQDKPYIIVASSLGTNYCAEILSKLENCRGFLALGSCMIGEGLGIDKVFHNNPNSAAVFMEEPTVEQIQNIVRDSITSTSSAVLDSVTFDFMHTDRTFRTAAAGTMAPGVLTDEIKTIANTKIPVAIAFGSDEKLCQINHLDFMADKFWQKKTHFIFGGGHLCHIDQPNGTAELLAAFAADCFDN